MTSPTFAIGNRYETAPPVSHLDLYRFQRVTAADWAALEPYFEDAIVFVEWPEAGKGWLPPPLVRVHLSHLDERRRRVELDSDRPELFAGII